MRSISLLVPLLFAALMGSLAVHTVGCQNKVPINEVYSLKEAYTTTLNALVDAVNKGQIKDQQTKDIIHATRLDIDKALADAETAARANKSVDYQFYMNRVSDLLETLTTIAEKNNVKPKPTTGPTTRASTLQIGDRPWNRRKSSLSYLQPRRSPLDSQQLMRRLSAANQSAMNSRSLSMAS